KQDRQLVWSNVSCRQSRTRHPRVKRIDVHDAKHARWIVIWPTAAVPERGRRIDGPRAGRHTEGLGTRNGNGGEPCVIGRGPRCEISPLVSIDILCSSLVHSIHSESMICK